MKKSKYQYSPLTGVTMNPRVGITQANRLNSFIFDDINNGIDLTFEEFLLDLEKEGLTEQEKDSRIDQYDNDNRVALFGSWKKVNGRYEVDKSGEFSAVYNNDSGNISVEWSRTLKRCAKTSPCYVMTDNSGPCGDLDSDGDDVEAYSLPAKYFNQEES